MAKKRTKTQKLRVAQRRAEVMTISDALAAAGSPVDGVSAVNGGSAHASAPTLATTPNNQPLQKAVSKGDPLARPLLRVSPADVMRDLAKTVITVTLLVMVIVGIWWRLRYNGGILF